MRSITRVSVIAAGVALALGTFQLPGRASCAAPEVRAPRAATPGDEITIRGDDWAAECNDTVVCSTGCGGASCSGGEPSPPERDLRVTLVPLVAGQGGAITLAEGIDADPRTFRFRITVAVPATLDPGRYRITARNDHAGVYRSQPITISPT